MTDTSPRRKLWNNFKRNWFAVGGLAFIILAVLIAVLGYLIIPDSTPDANNMLLPLSIKKPGAQFTLLRIKNPENVVQVNIFKKMLLGQPDAYRNVPITGYHFAKDSIYIDQYIGAEDKPERKTFNVYEVYYGIKPYTLGIRL